MDKYEKQAKGLAKIKDIIENEIGRKVIRLCVEYVEEMEIIEFRLGDFDN